MFLVHPVPTYMSVTAFSGLLQCASKKNAARKNGSCVLADTGKPLYDKDLTLAWRLLSQGKFLS